MSRKSSTTLTLSIRLRLPVGAKPTDAIEFIKDALEYQQEVTASIAHKHPLASLATKEIVLKVLKRETTYY